MTDSRPRVGMSKISAMGTSSDAEGSYTKSDLSSREKNGKYHEFINYGWRKNLSICGRHCADRKISMLLGTSAFSKRGATKEQSNE